MLESSVCRTCGNGYSELIDSDRDECSECRMERSAERGLRLQHELDINLGWTSRDPITQRAIYKFKLPLTMPMRDVW